MHERPSQPPLTNGTPSTWGTRLRRPRGRAPRATVAVSVLLHLLVIGGMWLAGVRLRPELPEFVQYRVTLVSPPPQEQGEPEPAESVSPVVTDPEPEPDPPPEPVETPAAPPEAKPSDPAPKPKPRDPAPAEKKPEEKPEERSPARGPDPRPVPVGGENMNVNIEGAEFPYPEYLENVVLQLKRYFRWSGSPNLEAEVVFHIQRDGSVGPGIRVVRKSGNFNFDLQAVEAVEQAGRTRAFRPLPDDWQGDRLYISFTFEPPR